MATIGTVLEDYEKDLVQRLGLTQRDLMFLEPEEIAAELKHRITLERAAEIRALLNLTTLKGVTLPTAKELFAAGFSNPYLMLEMKPEEIVEKVNAARAREGKKPWGETEAKKVARILRDNEDKLDEW